MQRRFFEFLADSLKFSAISLREAIDYAGTNDFGTTIKFNVAGTIYLNGTQLEITKSLIVDGEEKITIDAGQKSRVISVTGDDATLFGLTIRNGKAGFGGGICVIYAAGTTIINCTVTGNSAVGSIFARGVGIYANGSTIINSTVTGNSATDRMDGDS